METSSFFSFLFVIHIFAKLSQVPAMLDWASFNAVKDESLGLVSVSRLKVPETLGLVQNFGTCLVSVLSRMKMFGTVSSRSRLVGLIFT